MPSSLKDGGTFLRFEKFCFLNLNRNIAAELHQQPNYLKKLTNQRTVTELDPDKDNTDFFEWFTIYPSFYWVLHRTSSSVRFNLEASHGYFEFQIFGEKSFICRLPMIRASITSKVNTFLNLLPSLITEITRVLFKRCSYSFDEKKKCLFFLIK